jgi:fatty-acid peroxygenase
MAHVRDTNGKLLSPKLAAVEVINVIRPTVAVAWYVCFAAHALHAHPEWRQKLAGERDAGGHGEQIDCFMQEVRRFYPFTPYLGAKARIAFDWQGHRFEPGTLVLLDVHGTNHDARLWDEPDQFRPQRFERGHDDAYAFIPQGGGPRTGHRCPGEWITMHSVALALHFLTRCITYAVPLAQDLRIDLARMPTRPGSGMILSDVRALDALLAPVPSAPSITAARDSSVAERTGELGTAARQHAADAAAEASARDAVLDLRGVPAE